MAERNARRSRVHSVRRDAEEVRRLLLEWDFLGVVSAGAPADEYDCLIWPLTRMLGQDRPDDEIAEFLCAEATGHFGVAMSRQDALRFATHALERWRSLKGNDRP